MRKQSAVCLAAIIVCLLLSDRLPAAAPVMVSATHIGAAGEDKLEGVAIAMDGAIYIVGNSAALLVDAAVREEVPPTPKPYRDARGRPVPAAQYGCAFVAKVSSDGRRLVSMWQLAKGIANFTTVQVNENGVYVGGYATKGMDPLVAKHGGLITEAWDGQTRIRPHVQRDHYTDDDYDKTKDVRGCPVVLRFDHELSRIEAGTYLEGWQSIWHCPRPLGEDRWQRTELGFLENGDVVVCHDGGYQADPGEGEAGDYHFFQPPDHLSRLSPDLKTRRWKHDVHSPPMEPKKVNKYYKGLNWKHNYLGQTRTLRMRTNGKDRIVMGGWSPSQTSNEPWWSPFLFCLDARGEIQWRAYNPSPMSGGGDRMNGLVSDAAIRTVRFDEEGNVLFAGIGDGGNSVLRKDPRDYRKEAGTLRGTVHSFPGRVLFWGLVGRVDARTQALLGGNHLGGMTNTRRGPRYSPAWATDIVSAGDGRVLAIGRHNRGFGFTDNAWHRSDAGGFVRLYDPGFHCTFSTSLPDADVTEVAVRGKRAVIVGVARSEKSPRHKPFFSNRGGGYDGYLIVLDLPSAEDAERD